MRERVGSAGRRGPGSDRLGPHRMPDLTSRNVLVNPSVALESQMPDPQPAAPRRTPLTRVHEELGATMTDFAGWQMPLRYRSEIAEHNAVRTAARRFDLSHMSDRRRTARGARDARRA